MTTEEFNGIVGSSPTTEGEPSKNQDEQTVPYSRFKQVNQKLRDFEKKYDELERLVKNGNATANQERIYEELAELPVDQALRAIEDRAISKALERIKSDSQATQSEIEAANRLLDEGFDYLRDNGHKVTASVEKELSEIAIEYGINIDSPEDMAKVWKLYDTVRKTQGNGNSSRAATLGAGTRKADTSKGIATNGSWSDVVERVKAKHIGR